MASSTTTTTTTATASATDLPKGRGMGGPNPKDSMKSTWRRADKATWTFAHWVFEWLGMHQRTLDLHTPVHDKKDKMPYVPEWAAHRWVLVHAFIPLVLHQLYTWYAGANPNGFLIWLVYHAAFQAIAIHEFQALRRLGHIYGFLDGDKHERDEVPDIGVFKVFVSLNLTAVTRLAMTVLLTYNRAEAPLQMNWYFLPLEIGLYGIILDFFFYWYHRVMHDNGALWKYHRTHHLTKHPNALLTLYADEEQEFFDMVGIPFLAWATMRLMGMPMGFYEWWICHQYVVFAELAGHSGLRIHSSPPSTLTWALRLFKAELVIEDHDLHHRKGWRSSYNYGKQTRLWDRIFGTCYPRVEGAYENLDYNNPVEIPLWFKHV